MHDNNDIFSIDTNVLILYEQFVAVFIFFDFLHFKYLCLIKNHFIFFH